MEANNLLLKYLKQIPKELNLPPPSSPTVKVKQEKRDEPAPKPFPPPPPPPETRIVQPVPKAPTSVEKPADPSPPPIDFSSIQGRFGWIGVGKDYLPFIIRGDSKYFAVRMVESEIISKYTKILPYDAFTYTNIKSYYITESEAKLLNEINLFHCNGHYSVSPFTVKDVVVSVEDTEKFYDYLEFCKHKNELGNVRAKGEMRERCGLVQINKQYLMPYVTKDKQCYVLHGMLPPSVYCEASEQILDDWDLAYMKFVCWVVDVPLQKVQTSDKLCLVSNLKNYDNNSTVFQEVTVTKHLRDSLMNTAVQQSYHYHHSLKENYSRNVVNPNHSQTSGNLKIECKNGCGCLGPCSHLVDMRGNSIMSSSVLNGQLRAVPASGYWNSNSYSTGMSLDASQKVNDSYKNLRLSLNVPASDYLKANENSVVHAKSVNHNLTKNPVRSELDVLFPPPPPLVRVETAHSNNVTPVSASASPCDSGSLRPPPPLQPTAQYKSSGNPVIVDVLSLVSKDAMARTEEIRQSASRSPEDGLRRNAVIPPHHYPTPPQSSPLQSSVTPTPIGISMSMTGETSTILPGGAVIDLCSPPPSPDNRVRPVADGSCHQMAVPHVLQSVQVDGKYLPCINLEPFKHKSLLVTTVSALVSTFFPSVSVQSCQFALKNVLGVQLHPYRGMHQVSLASLGFLLTENDPLLSVTDAKLYLPHLVYMFQQTVSNDQSPNDRIMENSAPKRLCTSSTSDN